MGIERLFYKYFASKIFCSMIFSSNYTIRQAMTINNSGGTHA